MGTLPVLIYLCVNTPLVLKDVCVQVVKVYNVSNCFGQRVNYIHCVIQILYVGPPKFDVKFCH